MNKKEAAVSLYNDGFHCSQAVLSAFAADTGITEKQAHLLGGCFGAGMKKGEVCGACTGALMVLGLLYGQTEKGDTASKIHAYEVAEAFLDRFAERNGSYICNDLLGCDIRTEEGVAYARSRNLFRTLCPKMVEDSVEILEEIIREHGQRKEEASWQP